MDQELSYAAWLHFEGIPGVGVSFPDLPGCVTQGDTVEDALRLAREALALHIAGLLEEGEQLPEPSALEDLVKQREGELLVVDF